MRIYYELDLEDFEGWEGGEDFLREVEEAEKIAELEEYLELNYDYLTETELNDIFRFEADEIRTYIGMSEDDPEELEEDNEYSVPGARYVLREDVVSGLWEKWEQGTTVVTLDESSYPYCVKEETFLAFNGSLNHYDYTSAEFGTVMENVNPLPIDVLERKF